MKKVLIIEDNCNSRSMITKALYEVDETLKIYEAENAEEAYYLAMNHRMDLFIIDIILKTDIPGDVSGIVFADRIRKYEQYKYVPMIIITALEDQKLNAYSHLHCYSYLEKPINIQSIKAVLREVLEIPLLKQENKYVYFRKDGILYSILKDDIIFVTVESRHNKIVCKNETVEINYISCKKLLELLDSDNFIQCSRTTIVNRKNIKAIDSVNRYIFLEGSDEVLEIGIIMRKGFLQKLRNELD